MEFTVNYKDFIGRKNKAKSFGNDEFEVRDKFNVLYPNCRILSVEQN